MSVVFLPKFCRSVLSVQQPVKFVFKLKLDMVCENLWIFGHPQVRIAENDRSRGPGHKKGPQKRVPEQILGL